MPRTITDTKLLKKQPYQLTVPGKTLGLVSRAGYAVTLGSQNLGSFTAGEDANLSLTITIPPGQSSGYQLLDVSGPGLSGQPIDLRQTVFVEGTTDESAPLTNPAASVCVVVPASGHDVDQDGIDDACDGYIGQPPDSAPVGASPDGAASSPPNRSVTSSLSQNYATPASVANVIIQTGQPQSNTIPIQAATKSAPFSQSPPKSELPYNPQSTAQQQVLGAHSALPSAFGHPMNPVQPFPSYHSSPHNLWWLLVAIGFSTALIGAFYALWQHYQVKP